MIYLPILALILGLLCLFIWTMPTLVDLYASIWEVNHVIKRGFRAGFFALVLALDLTVFGTGAWWIYWLIQVVQ